MKKLLLAMCLSMAVVMVVAPAYATELWDWHLRGTDEGLASGALPPQGFYFINDSVFVPTYHAFNDLGHSITNVELFAYVDIPILLWSTGLKFLCADYAVAVAQPFDYTNLRIQNQGASIGVPGLNQWNGGAQWGAYNTVIVPIILSWKLPCDFRVKGEFAVSFDDGTTSPENRVKGQRFQHDGGIYAESSNGYYTFVPVIGISWLHAGWNISADIMYSINTKDTVTDYQSADEIMIDYTVSYTWKRWTLGLGAAQQNQIAADKQYGVSVPGSRVTNYSIGPLLGYNFGPCSLMLTYGWDLLTKNDVGGEALNARLVIPLGNLCPLGK
ncbi:MAG: transporter [Syntrophobacteraceae bacterium]